MAQTQLRGTTQILDGTIPLSKLAAGYSIPTSNLADGADFIKRTGTVAFTANTSLGGSVFTTMGDAVNPQDSVNLRTAQSLINGIAIKRARLVITSNVALSGTTAIDSVTPTAGDIVLATAQSTASQNGPWTVAAGSWTRPVSWAAASTQKSTIFYVEEGTVYHDTKWIGITDAVTVDTTAVTISQDLSGISYTNGSGLSLTGATFAVKVGNGIVIDGSSNVSIQLNGSSLNLSGSGIKIADGTAGQLMLANSSNAAQFLTLSGDATLSSAGALTVNHTAGSGFLKYTDITYNETPSGSVNGVNTSFTLTTAPVNSSLKLYYNGVLLEPGAGNDYTISTNTITMLFAPVTGDKLRAYYAK